MAPCKGAPVWLLASSSNNVSAEVTFVYLHQRADPALHELHCIRAKLHCSRPEQQKVALLTLPTPALTAWPKDLLRYAPLQGKPGPA